MATATTTVLAGSASFAGKLNGGGSSSSKGSSVNASRTTTPTMSESEFGAGAAAVAGSEEQALNSLGSDANSAGSLHKAVASKLAKTTISLAPASRLALKRTLPVNGGTTRLNATTSSLPQRKPLVVGGSVRKNGSDQLNATDHHLTTPGVLGRNGSTTISRSPTYTRSLNAATTSKLAAGPRSGKVTSKAAPTAASQLLSTKGAHRGLPATTSFAKPTTSSTLKKSAATATATTSSAVSALKRASSPATSCSSSSYKRPSSVASNCSSVASSCYSAAAAISRQPKNGALRTPLSKRTTAAAAAGATKAIGTPAASSTSRRSSATSGASSKSGAFGSQFSGPTGNGSGSSSPHTAHKQTTTEQLRQYQALYWQQTETLKRYRLEHCRSTLQSTALLTVTAHLINEYSPFETPLLRRELHSLHAKCCKLNRDYELSKEAASQKEEIILRLEKRLWEQCQQLDSARAEVTAATEKTAKLEAELAEGVSERSQLEEQAAGLRQQLEAEKEEHSSVLAKLTALEESCRSDRKYRDLKEKINTYQKEVDSLNVVLEMKAARNRNLETEQMRLQMELANYECLKETYQTLRRENEALSETVSLKARKNAEHAREIDSLRASLKKEVNERKRASIRGDQLEYKLNETIELLHTMSMSEAIGEEEGSEEEKDAEGGGGVTNQQNSSSFVPQYYSSVSKRSNGPSQHYQHSQQRSSTTNSRTAVRRLFSTPGSLVMPGGALPAGGEGSSSSQQRAHFQHQEPQGGHHHPHHHTHHRSALPELVLSSIGASTGLHWSSTNSGPSSAGSSSSSSGTAATTFSSVARSAGDSNSSNSNGHSHHQQQNHQHSSPPNSPKQGSRQLSSAGKEKVAKTTTSAPPASTSPPSAVQVPTSTTTD